MKTGRQHNYHSSKYYCICSKDMFLILDLDMHVNLLLSWTSSTALASHSLLLSPVYQFKSCKLVPGVVYLLSSNELSELSRVSYLDPS